MTQQFDALDKIVLQVAKGNTDYFYPLSTGERIYVALAANNIQLLADTGYTIAEALARLEADWTSELIARWRYKGDPSKYQDQV
jgi:hypothetical protein